MNTNDTNRQKAHAMIDHIFKDLFPAQGMAERSEQIKLSHRMLDNQSESGGKTLSFPPLLKLSMNDHGGTLCYLRLCVSAAPPCRRKS